MEAAATDFGWLSIIPPVVAIALAILTRQVYVALGLFIFLGWTIMRGGNPLAGLVASADAVVAVLTDPDNTRVLMFSAMVGAIITFTQRSGGMDGFVAWAEGRGLARTRRRLQLFTVLISGVLFLESIFGLLVTGSIARPLFDRTRISRERLAYVLDATCSPKCILIPLNAWGAYIVGLLAAQGVDQPVALLLSTIPVNFYAIAAIVLALVVILADWDLGQMRTAEARVREEGLLLRPGARPMVSADVTTTPAKEGAPKRSVNMLVPLLVMVITVPVVLLVTGDGDLRAGSGSRAVFWGVVAGLLTGGVAYRLQGIMKLEELTDTFVKGVQGLIPLVLVLLLAYAIGATTRALGTGVFVAHAAQATLPVWLVPAAIFLIACFISFATGTSWGTFAIMLPIVVPMIDIIGLHPGLAVASALSGGIFGAHCSPISDSTIVSSMASATDHIDHVRTQLPYAILSASVALALFTLFAAL
jgi:Na+/H+ antiporter NhaC